MSARTSSSRRRRPTLRNAQRIRPLVQELEPRNQPAGLGLSVALLHAEGHAEAAALSLNVSDMVSIAPFHAVSVAGHGSLNSASTPFSAAFNSGFSEFLSALEQFEARSIEVFNASITLEKGKPNSVFDTDGSAVVIHAGKDDYKSDPTGNAGERIACGVITE